MAFLGSELPSLAMVEEHLVNYFVTHALSSVEASYYAALLFALGQIVVVQ